MVGSKGEKVSGTTIEMENCLTHDNQEERKNVDANIKNILFQVIIPVT